MANPARRIKRSAVKNIVRFPAIKANGGKTILVESILESKYCLHLEFDPDVVTYFPQPKTFTVPVNGEKLIYTPDFEVYYRSSRRRYIEIKPRKQSESEHYQQLFQGFASMLEDPLCDFLLVDESTIYQQPLLSNYEKLYRYRKRPLLDMANFHRCRAMIDSTMPLAQLIDRLKGRAGLKEIYCWLAMGYLQFDLRHKALTMETEVSFNVS